jgi:3-hydroxyacyl-[acyl-carrier-protein] dehydratase
MRFQLVDGILIYEPGKTITGVKQISVEANNIVPFAPKRLIYPATLCVEALAQLGSLLVSASFHFSSIAVLGMISSLVLNEIITTGSELMITARALEISREVAVVEGEINIDDRLVLSAERIVYGLVELTDELSKKEFEDLFKTLRETQIRPISIG